MEPKVEVVHATEKDAPLLMEMIRELSVYEKMPEQVKIDEKKLAEDMRKGSAKALLVMENGQAAAMTVYCYTYHTWVGEVMHMEDLYVRRTHRRKGYGMLLWRELARIAEERGCGFFQWVVLDWNKNAIDFYKQMPVEDITETEGWKWMRMDQQGIKTLARAKI